MADLRYTKNGEWASYDGTQWKVGLARSAVDELGDVTFVELPALGRTLVAGEAACALEAVKAAADYYSPLGGTVCAVNNTLGADPQALNSAPEEGGWIFALTGVKPESFLELMDKAGWAAWENGR